MHFASFTVESDKGIVGDANYDDNSDLYEACGYIRKREKKSGLTHKNAKAADKKTPPAN